MFPSWVTAFGNTTVEFWKDPDEVTWEQLAAMYTFFTGTGYALARFPFFEGTRAGFSFVIVINAALVTYFMLYYLLGGTFLGRQNFLKLLRLISIHLMLNIGIVFLSSLGLYGSVFFRQHLLLRALYPSLISCCVIILHSRRKNACSGLRSLSTLCVYGLLICMGFVVTEYGIYP